MFDYAFPYEDRDELHTSRWAFDGVNTQSGGNLLNGRVWATFSDSSNTVTVNVYQDADCTGDTIATGTADISDIDSAPVKCSLSEANSSGLSGQFYFESYSSDPAAGVEVLVSLCDDADLAEEHVNLSSLNSYNTSTGMAKWCAAATRKALLLASQTFAEELGGFGAPEHRYRMSAERDYPRYDRLANPDQLKDAATHWALVLAFGACVEMADDTMYSELRDYHEEKRLQAISAWHLAINRDPDDDDDADVTKSSGMVRTDRV